MTEQEQFRDSYRVQPPKEKGFLVGIGFKREHPLLTVEDSLEELTRLAETAGVQIVGQATQQLEKPHPATLIGPGKVEEVKTECLALGVDVVIFDDELNPRHQRELEKIFGEDIKVLDRSALILDIFARHAQTREGALQVELAQYEYRLPRLTRQWSHLARQSGGGAARAGGGGVGLRGPGETQLEVDRREISRRITKLKTDLDAVRAHRGRHREQRKQAGISVVALVGYTNAGKSTLLNRLSNADVYVADQLFATLDPTTRRVEVEGGQAVLFSDTVGFIQKLPTTLIAAFRATLEEISEATLIVHVADASHPNVIEQIDAVEDTLAEIELPRMPRVLALNKIDRLEDGGGEELQAVLQNLDESDYSAIVPVSARTGQGLNDLLQAIEQLLAERMTAVHILVDYERGDITSLCHEQGVITSEHTPDGVIIKGRIPDDLAAQILALDTVTDLSGKG
jgi:GTP-binding protein HflX